MRIKILNNNIYMTHFSKAIRATKRKLGLGLNTHPYNTVQKINNLSQTDIDNINVSQIKCKNIIPRLHELRPEIQKQIRQFCRAKELFPHNRTIKAKTYKSNLSESKNPLYAELKKRLNKLHSSNSKKKEENLQKRLDKLHYGNSKPTVESLQKRLNNLKRNKK